MLGLTTDNILGREIKDLSFRKGKSSFTGWSCLSSTKECS
jgi:hypothetical protein